MNTGESLILTNRSASITDNAAKFLVIQKNHVVGSWILKIHCENLWLLIGMFRELKLLAFLHLGLL